MTGELNGEVKVRELSLVAGVNKVKKDATFKVTATPKENYTLKAFAIDGVSKLADATKGVEVLFNKAIAIDVEFEAKAPEQEKFTLTYVQPQNGTLTVKNGEEVVTTGATISKTTLTIVAKPNEKFELESIKVYEEELVAKVDKTTFAVQYEVTKNVTIVAKFKPAGTAVSESLFAQVSIQPNPCQDVLQIEGAEQLVRYELLNLHGLIIESGVLAAPEQNISTALLAAGMYLLRLSHASGASQTLRVVKQ